MWKVNFIVEIWSHDLFSLSANLRWLPNRFRAVEWQRIHFFRRYESYNAKMKRFNSIIITYELAEESEK